jgi:O-antigen ligase
MHPINRIAFGALWMQIFVLPWERFFFIPGIGTLGRFAGIIALPLGLLDVMRRGQPRPLTRFHVLIGLFVWWAGLSIFWSQDPSATSERLWTYVQLAVLTWLIWEFARTPERQFSLLQAYVLGAYVSAFDTVGHFLSGTMVTTYRYAASGFNPNDLGFTLVLAVPMAWYLALTRRGKVARWLNLLYLPIGVVAVLLTASRGAFIPGLAALLIIPWTLSRHSLATRLAICALLVVSGFLVLHFIPTYSWTRLASASEEIESGDLNDRTQIWAAGLQAFRQHPIVGVGAGAFETAVQPTLIVSRPPHQTFLSVLVGQGLIGLLLFLAIFVAALVPVRRMPAVPRAFWAVLFLTLAIGLQPRTWDYRKQLWFVLGLLAAQGALTRTPEVMKRVVVRAPAGVTG